MNPTTEPIKEISVLKEYELNCGVVRVHDFDIISYEPKGNFVTVADLKEQLALYQKLRNGKPGPFLSDNRKISSAGSEEKQFIKENFHLFANKAAVVVSSGISQFLLNVFLHISPPNIPMKGFKTHQAAFDWLLKE